MKYVGTIGLGIVVTATGLFGALAFECARMCAMPLMMRSQSWVSVFIGIGCDTGLLVLLTTLAALAGVGVFSLSMLRLRG